MRHYQFKVKWQVALPVACLFALLLSLGFWQLDRAEQKAKLLTAYEVSQMAPPQDFDGVLFELDADTDSLYQSIEVFGAFQTERYFLLENKIRDGVVGVEVLIPLQIPGHEQWLIVNRGWMPWPEGQRNVGAVKAALEVNEDGIALTGLLRAPNSRYFALGPIVDNPGQWPQLLQQPDLAVISESLNAPLYPWILLLESDINDGLVREWALTNIMPPAKHIGYAVQWFSLALALLVLFIVVSTHRVKRPADKPSS